MPFITLTRGYQAEIDEIDIDLAAFKWHANWKKNRKTVYAARNGSRKLGSLEPHTFHLHVEIAKRMGIIGKVDHKDLDGLNNKRENLRSANHAQNQRNKPLQVNNTSGYRGVVWKSDIDQWQVRVKVNGKQLYFGCYPDKEEANKVAIVMRNKLHGEFANHATKKEGNKRDDDSPGS